VRTAADFPCKMPNLSSHADPEVLEQFILGHLSPEKEARIEDHLMVCDHCREALERADQEVLLLKAALRELVSEG
jgi:anti-sigma factor RsiW